MRKIKRSEAGLPGLIRVRAARSGVDLLALKRPVEDDCFKHLSTTLAGDQDESHSKDTKLKSVTTTERHDQILQQHQAVAGNYMPE